MSELTMRQQARIERVLVKRKIKREPSLEQDADRVLVMFSASVICLILAAMIACWCEWLPGEQKQAEQKPQPREVASK